MIFRLPIVFFVFLMANSSLALSMATFRTIDGTKTIQFDRASLTKENAPLFYEKIQAQDTLSGTKAPLSFDMQDLGAVDIETLKHIFKFLAGKPLILGDYVKTTFLINHASGLELPSLGRAMIERLPIIIGMFESAEDVHPFSQIAQAICNAAFDKEGNSKGFKHWTHGLLMGFQAGMDRQYIPKFQEILSKKERGMVSLKALLATSNTPFVTFHNSEETKK